MRRRRGQRPERRRAGQEPKELLDDVGAKTLDVHDFIEAMVNHQGARSHTHRGHDDVADGLQHILQILREPSRLLLPDRCRILSLSLGHVAQRRALQGRRGGNKRR